MPGRLSRIPGQRSPSMGTTEPTHHSYHGGFSTRQQASPWCTMRKPAATVCKPEAGVRFLQQQMAAVKMDREAGQG